MSARNFNVCDIVLVRHDRQSHAALVLGTTEHAFTLRCSCGALFLCRQTDAYPNHTTGRNWEPWHDEAFGHAVLRMQQAARLVIAVGVAEAHHGT